MAAPQPFFVMADFQIPFPAHADVGPHVIGALVDPGHLIDSPSQVSSHCDPAPDPTPRSAATVSATWSSPAHDLPERIWNPFGAFPPFLKEPILLINISFCTRY